MDEIKLFHPAFSCVTTLCYNGRFVLSYFRPALLVLADTNRHMLKNVVLVLSIRNFVYIWILFFLREWFGDCSGIVRESSALSFIGCFQCIYDTCRSFVLSYFEVSYFLRARHTGCDNNYQLFSQTGRK